MTHWTLIDIVNDLLCVVIACLWTRLRWLAEDEARAEAQRRLCQNEMETDKSHVALKTSTGEGK